jgi:hypothetical protein
MSYTTIDKPTDYFNTVTYSGNGSTQSITGVGFQPDMLWGKNRSSVTNHELTDVVRGINQRLKPNDTDADQTNTNTFTSFDSDGFSLGTDADVNASGANHVVWSWKAGGSASSNTDGSITSSVSANTTAGFSIVSYTGTGSSATVGTGLNAVPKMVITRNRDTATNWCVYSSEVGNTKALFLNLNNASDTATQYWNDTTPTSSVFSVGTNTGTNKSGDGFVAYCFAEKKGYSKIGKYTGNGNADGTFVYTGFKPALVIIKNYSRSSENWNLIDNKRDGFNGSNENLAPNLSGAESSGNNRWDILSNGFKCRDTNNEVNGSGDTYVFMAFAESPFVNSNGVPNNAR